MWTVTLLGRARRASLPLPLAALSMSTQPVASLLSTVPVVDCETAEEAALADAYAAALASRNSTPLPPPPYVPLSFEQPPQGCKRENKYPYEPSFEAPLPATATALPSSSANKFKEPDEGFLSPPPWTSWDPAPLPYSAASAPAPPYSSTLAIPPTRMTFALLSEESVQQKPGTAD
jgi:hypothetical protein